MYVSGEKKLFHRFVNVLKQHIQHVVKIALMFSFIMLSYFKITPL